MGKGMSIITITKKAKAYNKQHNIYIHDSKFKAKIL